MCVFAGVNKKKGGAEYNATVYSGGSWSHMKVYRVFTVLEKYYTYTRMVPENVQTDVLQDEEQLKHQVRSTSSTPPNPGTQTPAGGPNRPMTEVQSCDA